jgi:ElaB/YqjD/DUF883 family membrane-anchored ribosome-binding protein
MQITQNNPASNANSKDANVSEVTSGVAREFHSFVADIEDLIKATTSLTGEELNRAKAKLNQRIASAKSSVEDISETVVNRARKTAETTNTYVHEQPWTAVGVGAAAGLLVGYLLSRRS